MTHSSQPWSPLPFDHEEYKNNETYRINALNYLDYYFEVFTEKDFDSFFFTVLNHTDNFALEDVAKYGLLPEQYLAELAKIDDANLQVEVAFNANTSLETLKCLAQTTNVEVLTAVAGSSNCSWTFLESLANQYVDNNEIFDAIIWNSKTPFEYLLDVLKSNNTSNKLEVLKRIKYLPNQRLYNFCFLLFGSDVVYIPESILQENLLKWVENETKELDVVV